MIPPLGRQLISLLYANPDKILPSPINQKKKTRLFCDPGRNEGIIIITTYIKIPIKFGLNITFSTVKTKTRVTSIIDFHFSIFFSHLQFLSFDSFSLPIHWKFPSSMLAVGDTIPTG